MNNMRILRVGVALVLVGVLLYFFNPFSYVTKLLAAAPFIILLSLLGIAASMTLNAMAYHRMLIKREKISLRAVLESVFFAWAAESLLPGKIGSFSAAWLWKGKGIPLVRGLSTIAVYRFVVGMVTLLIAIGGGVFLFPSVSFPIEIVLGVLTAVLIVGYVAIYSSLFPRIITRLFPAFKGHATTTLEHVRETFSDPGQMTLLGLNALAQLVVNALLFQGMFVLSGITAPFSAILAATAIVQIAALIPISINGLGIREGLMGVLLGLVGVPPALTVGIAAINTATGYAITFIISLIGAGKIVKDSVGKEN